MATFFSGQTVGYWSSSTNYIYGTLTGNVSRSGNTVTLSGMKIALTTRYSSTGSDNLWFEVNGTRTSYKVSASGTSLGTHTLNNTSFSVSTTQTSANVGWKSSDNYTGSFNVTFPSGASAPTGLAASNVVATKNSFSATVSITGWGNGATDARYREFQVWTYNASSFVEPRRYQAATGTALSSTITCNNSSSGSLTITPNTRYTLGVYANNGNASTGSQRVGDYVTLPDELTDKAVSNIQTKSITITAKTKADGNFYAKEIQYSLNNSTWTTGATISSGSVSNVSFNITGLTPGTNYTIYLRVKTTAGTTSCGSLTAKTKSVVKIVRISGGATQVIDALPYIIKPDGTKKELKINYVRQ